jgi:hypothetical protein
VRRPATCLLETAEGIEFGSQLPPAHEYWPDSVVEARFARA